MYYTLHAEDELIDALNEASKAFINKEYQTAYNKYKVALQLLGSLNLNVKDSIQNTIEYILCIILLQSDTFHNIIEALNILMNLEDTIGEFYPAVYYAIAKAYIKLYRFNFAINTINKGLAILNEETHFTIQYIPMTSIIINETTREGLLISLMDLQEKASSWHCPNAKCFLENCQNNIPYCSPCRDIFFSDPTFSGLVTITCSNSSNPCKLNFHPICWKFQKNKLHIENKLSDMDMIGRSCFTSNCGTKDKNVITKIEILNNNAKVVSVIENSSLSMLLVSDSPVNGAIKKHRFIKPIPKLRRPNFLLRKSQEECIKPFKEISEKEMKLMKLIQLRENNFGIPRENLEPGKDMFNNEDINSTNILSECESENIDSETIQQCRFLSEIMYEFIKVNLIVHKNKLLSKWHETKEIMEYITKTDEYLDSDILNFLLKSPKLIRIGDYICVPQAIQQMFHLFENEITKQYKLVLESETNEYKDTTPTDNENILHEECITNDDSKTNQSPQKLLGLINDVFEDNNVDEDNNIYQNDNTCESSATSLDSCSTNETEINSICKSENEFVLKSNNECFDVNNFKQDDDYEQPIFYKEDKSFNYNNDITNKDDCTNVVYDDTNSSHSSTKNPFLEENMTNNSIKNIFIQDFEQLTNDELLSPTVLQDKYKLLAYNYFVIVQNFAKLSKEKTDMEDSFKLKLKEKDSIMKTVIEERKILIDRLDSYESHISEKVSDNYDELNADILKLKSNINRLEQEKNYDECSFKLLIEEKNTIEKILREDNAQLLKNVKDYEAEINKKNEELNILQDNDLRWKKSFLQKSLESQYYSNKNMLMNGIDYCNLSLDIINRLNSLIKKYIGMHIIPDYIEWSFTLNQFLKLSSEYEAEFLKCISSLKSKTEVQKLDEINMSSINLPKYPNKSLSTIVCNVFMALDKHITEISTQNLSTMLPSSLSLHSLSKLEEFSNNGKIIEKNSNVNLFKTEGKFNKHTEDEFQNILKNPDLNEENNEAVQCHLECIDNNKVGNSTLETNVNEHKNQINGILEDVNNKAKPEIAESKNFPNDITNNELLETCDNNKVESSSISNETDHKLLMEEVDFIEQKNQKTEDITKENNTNIEENSKKTSINSTDELMNILRSKYTGISDQSLLESLNDLQKFHKKKSLTDIPLNIIIQDVQKFMRLR